MKKQIVCFFVIGILCLLFFACDNIATLFHGEKPGPVTYTVTFNANGATIGVPPAPQTVHSGNNITIPDQGTLNYSGKTFDCWNTESTGTGANYGTGSFYTVNDNITLYAKWDTLFTVTFNSNGGSNVVTQTIISGGMADRPEDPTQANYLFDNWYSDSEFQYRYNFSTPVGGTITLYAKWNPTHTVNFNSNGGSPVPSQTVLVGERISQPPDPLLDRYYLEGWYSDSGWTTMYNFSAPVTGSFILYAKWNELQPDSYLVTFNSNGGDHVPNQTIVLGGTVSKPIPSPLREHYIFDGWYNDSGLNNEYIFSTPVSGNMNLYAKWNRINYTVNFNSNSGSAVPGQTVASGNRATRPQDPTRSGYTFDNWYSDPGLTNLYDFYLSVIGNVTLYAKWNWNNTTVDYYTVTFNPNGGSDVFGTLSSEVKVRAGSSIYLPSGFYLFRMGYTFAGWNTNSSGTGTDCGDGDYVMDYFSNNTLYTPTDNITLYAKWIISSFIPSHPSTPITGMVWIEAGTFMMGSPETEPGYYKYPSTDSWETLHQVTLTSGFYMSRTPVTQAQYQAVMGTNPSSFSTNSTPPYSYLSSYALHVTGLNTDNFPVENVSWYDALVFCNKLSIQEGLIPAYSINGSSNPDDWGTVPTGSNSTWDKVVTLWGSTGYRLPTEAQWEYACRAGTTTAFNWGTNYINQTQANFYASHVSGNNIAKETFLHRTTPVGSYAPNAWGLYDMHGNVDEWCWDMFGSYPSGAQTNPMGAAYSSDRVKRGGGWSSYSPYLRSGKRNASLPTSMWTGFRIVRP